MQERVVVPVWRASIAPSRPFILAATLEYSALPDDLSANVVGRSSWGRLGLIVATAVFVHPGFRGCLTLELVNEGTARLLYRPDLASLSSRCTGLSMQLPRGRGRQRSTQPPYARKHRASRRSTLSSNGLRTWERSCARGSAELPCVPSSLKGQAERKTSQYPNRAAGSWLRAKCSHQAPDGWEDQWPRRKGGRPVDYARSEATP